LFGFQQDGHHDLLGSIHREQLFGAGKKKEQENQNLLFLLFTIKQRII
jgi:hypothetical protein